MSRSERDKMLANELYLAGSWKWLTLKYSYSLGDTFGVDDAKGTWYLDLTGAYPLTEQLTLIGHVGYQKYRGSIGGVSNDELFSYTDWKLELAYALEGGWTLGAAYTGTNAEDAGYTLLGADLEWAQPVPGGVLVWSLRARNLLDEDARRHTSFLKDVAPLPGANLIAGVEWRFD